MRDSKFFAILYGLWFTLIFAGGTAASWWYKRQHGAST